MKVSTIIYQGDLRCEATHLASGNTITTDAPLDNHGKGDAFSPTDLTATSLALCIITTIGIAAPTKNIELSGLEADVEKVMAADPRRIAAIIVEVRLRVSPDTPENREKIEYTGRHCPVALSLHPEVKQEIRFVFG